MIKNSNVRLKALMCTRNEVFGVNTGLDKPKDWKGRLEDYDLNRYPDYEPNKPPRLEKLHKFSFLDELELIWDKPWGAQGIGKLREVGLIKPNGDHESNPLWAKDPTFFLLRQGVIEKNAADLLEKQHEIYANTLKENGVSIEWMDIDNPMGAYGPMRKLYMAEEVFVARGGAIMPRFGHASYKRGLEAHFQKFIARIGCPILATVCGYGIFEPGPGVLPIAEDVVVLHQSCGGNQEGIDQIIPVLKRCGLSEYHVSHMQGIMDSFESGGEFHIDMVLGPVDIGLAIVYPGNLDYQTYEWLKSKHFKLIEIPADEQKKYVPANCVVIEPGKVIMPAGAVKVNAALRKEGVDVIEVENTSLTKGGTNGIRCMTMFLIRDKGPRLEEIKR